MRWFAPIVIVTLVVAGTSRADGPRASAQRSSMSASHASRVVGLRDANRTASKCAPRSGFAARGAVSDRRVDHDEVFVIPRVIALVSIPIVERVSHPSVPPTSTNAALVEEVARGPPSPLVVLSNPIS